MPSAFDGPLPEQPETAQVVRTQRKQSVVWAANWLTFYPEGFLQG
jgi:hypothetical protein